MKPIQDSVSNLQFQSFSQILKRDFSHQYSTSEDEESVKRIDKLSTPRSGGESPRKPYYQPSSTSPRKPLTPRSIKSSKNMISPRSSLSDSSSKSGHGDVESK